MRFYYKVLLFFVAFVASIAAAQTPDYTNVGRTPTPEEIRAEDIGIGPSGRGLPPGSGTAKQGAVIFAAKCAVCHGEAGVGGNKTTYGGLAAPALLGGNGTLNTPRPVKSVGNWWPFATTVWDYINRAMPRFQGGSLKPDEVYALTAYVLYRSDIVKETDVIDATTLPKIVMPNRNGFIPSRIEDIADAKKRGCQNGRCPY